MTGFEVCREVRSRNDQMGKVKIIMLTAKIEARDFEAEEKYGCNLFLTKPIDPGRLKELVRDTLEGSTK